jgi:hypothetical protein
MFNGSHVGGSDRAYVFIAGVDEDFVEDFVKTRVEIEFPPYHLVGRGVICPASFLVGLGTANICIWKFQNMLVMSVFLIFTSSHLGLKFNRSFIFLYGFKYLEIYKSIFKI